MAIAEVVVEVFVLVGIAPVAAVDTLAGLEGLRLRAEQCGE